MSLRVHAIQTGTVQIHRSQVRGEGKGARRRAHTLFDRHWTEPLPILAWAVELPEGVLVIDTGETAAALGRGYFPWWQPYFRLAVRESLTADDEAGPGLRRAGIDPADVRWVVMTHLHTDHAGGLGHFPNAEIVVNEREYEDARGFSGKVRGYLPHRWPDWFSPKLVKPAIEAWEDFSCTLPMHGIPGVQLVATPGHTPGHMSVGVEDDGVLLFFAGDASYTQETMLERTVDGVSPDDAVAAATLDRIAKLAAKRPMVYLPTHDPGSVARLAARETVS